MKFYEKKEQLVVGLERGLEYTESDLFGDAFTNGILKHLGQAKADEIAKRLGYEEAHTNWETEHDGVIRLYLIRRVPVDW